MNMNARKELPQPDSNVIVLSNSHYNEIYLRLYRIKSCRESGPEFGPIDF